MTAATNAFGDVLGPRGRAKVRVATVVSLVLLALLLAYVVKRFADNGQLAAERWEELLSPVGLQFLLEGLVATLKAAAVAGAASLLVGTLMALGRLSSIAPLRWLATTYVQLFRALPSLLLISFAYFGLRSPQIGLDVSPFTALVIGLTLYNSAVVAEVVRAGVRSLPRGQTEAAYALGLTRGQTSRNVLLPQAYLRMLPALVSQLVTVLKDTAYGNVISYEELLRRGTIAGETTRSPLQGFLLAAVGYVLVCFALSRFARYLEKRQQRKYGARAAVTGVEDVAA